MFKIKLKSGFNRRTCLKFSMLLHVVGSHTIQYKLSFICHSHNVITSGMSKQSVSHTSHNHVHWLHLSITVTEQHTCCISCVWFHLQWLLLSTSVRNVIMWMDWIVQCFTEPPTQYRLYGRQFLQVKRPNQQYQSTEGESCKGKENNPKKCKGNTNYTYAYTHKIAYKYSIHE